MSTEKTIAEIGYKVMPAKNGGFIVTAYVPSHPHGVEYAFSNSRDLIAFLQEQHFPAVGEEHKQPTRVSDSEFVSGLRAGPLPEVKPVHVFPCDCASRPYNHGCTVHKTGIYAPQFGKIGDSHV